MSVVHESPPSLVERLRTIGNWPFDVESRDCSIEATEAADEIERLRAHADAIAQTISFLSSVIRCGEPFTPDVQQAVDNAFTRLRQMAVDP